VDLAHIALETVRRVDGVSYADARVVQHESETLVVKDSAIDKHVRDRSAGIGVRVLFRGAWGFGAQPGPTADGAAQAARDALASARAAASLAPDRVKLAEEEPQRGTWATPVGDDPFAVPLDRKLADLEAALAILRGPRAMAEARMMWRRERKRLCTTDGTDVSQTLVFGGAGIKLILRDGDDFAVRTWPMDYDGGVRSAGYETIAELALAANATRLRDEAAELLAAPPLPAGTRTLVLDTPQLALQIHESCGHPTESDRALGEEISLAGGSFLTPDKLGRFCYGSPIVNLYADSVAPGGLGTFGWDDEGVPARRTPLVSRGMFVGYLSSRETAARLGLGRSAGCLRAESWSRPAIIRMINVSLEPDPRGPATLDALIADTDDGVLMTQNRSWSIDDLRLNFQFGCEAAWEVKHGRRGRMFKKPVYTGSTPRFWAGCDAIGGPDAFRMWGFANCGKGDPMQLMAVGHGTAPARFRDVDVGSSA
jgi:TldD protein